MNLAQRIVLILGFLIILSMALFPPWIYVYDPPEIVRRHESVGKTERSAGYHLVWNNNIPDDQAYLTQLFSLNADQADLKFFSMRIDGTRWTIQIIAALLLTGILYLALRPSKGNGSRSPTH